MVSEVQTSSYRQAHLAECVRAACLLEATARKPGNVHPGAAFDDLFYDDFVRSADVIAPILARAGDLGVGPVIKEAVSATVDGVGRNTNLGIVLLLAPLSAVPEEESLADGIGSVLAQLTVEDARSVFRAIRAAQPGGMGTVVEQDISAEPTVTLLEVMRLAAERDAVAAQYVDGFALVLKAGVPFLQSADFSTMWEQAVIGLHLRLMSERPDTLIARKCDWATAQQSAHLARRVLESGWPHTERSREKLKELDTWLRADGNRRNPGATADLVTACLFAALREREIEAPGLSQIRRRAAETAARSDVAAGHVTRSRSARP